MKQLATVMASKNRKQNNEDKKIIEKMPILEFFKMKESKKNWKKEIYEIFF